MTKPNLKRAGVAPVSDPVASAFSRIVALNLRLRSRLLAAGDALGTDLDMSQALWQVLASVNVEPRTVPQIARRLGLTRQGVQQSANKLVERGLVSLAPNPDHSLASLVTITRSGQKIATELSRRQAGLAARIARNSGLNARQLNEVADQLEQLHRAASLEAEAE